MKVLLRADADVEHGTGHVMRCLSLAEGLRARGHVVELLGSIGAVPWLKSLLESSDIATHVCEADALDPEQVSVLGADRVVVDSYAIPSEQVSQLARDVPCLAIIDGDDRGIEAGLYLDQNIGAEDHDWPAAVTSRLLAGSRFALVRDAILAHRRSPRGSASSRPLVVTFMGGTDPTGAVVDLAESLVGGVPGIRQVFVCPERLAADLRRIVGDRPDVTVVPPTADLPAILGDADIAISAAGTSTWDLCTMGVPSVVISLVENQRESMLAATERGLALGFDASRDGQDLSPAITALEHLLADAPFREAMSSRCLTEFDGLGKVRVAEALESL